MPCTKQGTMPKTGTRYQRKHQQQPAIHNERGDGLPGDPITRAEPKSPQVTTCRACQPRSWKGSTRRAPENRECCVTPTPGKCSPGCDAKDPENLQPETAAKPSQHAPHDNAATTSTPNTTRSTASRGTQEAAALPTRRRSLATGPPPTATGHTEPSCA